MIGLFGGTFDPIHYGHLRAAHEASRRLGLRAVHLVPAANPPHRPAPAANATHRLRMVELAAAEFPGLIADDREIRRGGMSYTVTTLESLRAEVGTEPLCLLLGSDAFAGLASWHRWTELNELAHLVVLARPGYAMAADGVPAWAQPRVCREADDLARRPAGGVWFLPVASQDISASRLRRLLAGGGTPSASELPSAVSEYVRYHHLYRSSSA